MTDIPVQPAYLFEGFRLDAQRRVLFGVDGHAIALTPRLFDALLYFVERAGQLLTKEQLLEAIWPNVIVEEHNLNKTVSELRHALGEKPGEHRFFVTKPGQGYRFVARVSVDTPPLEDRADNLASVAPRPERRSRYWVAAGLGAVGVAIGFALLGLFGGAPDSPPRLTPLSLEKGPRPVGAVWSPDSKSVAFTVREADGQFHLVVRDVDSRVSTPIVSGVVPPVVVQWTTTGRILFGQGPNIFSVSPISAMPEIVEGLDRRNVRAGVVSRDGKAAAVVRPDEEGVFGLWTSSLPTVSFERYDAPAFKSQQLNNVDLQFSPDGRQLLVIWNSAGAEGIWLAPFPPDPDRPPRRVLEALPTVIGSGFSWLPDNRHIVVATAEGTRAPQLHVADTQSGAFRQFTHDLRAKRGPSVSPDGKRLVYYEAEADYDIVALDLAAAEVRPLIATQDREEQARWAADVAAMVYKATRGAGPYEIWLRRPGEIDVPLVTEDVHGPTHFLFSPSLSPDGTRVIYQTTDKQTEASHLWTVRATGGSSERVTNGSNERAGSWSPDGAWYVFWQRQPDGSDTLKKVRTTGHATAETLISGVEPSQIVPIWSPDGQWILVPNRGLQRVSLGDLTARRLGIENAPCTFARNEPLIYCLLDARADGLRPFVALDFDGKRVKEIGTVRADLAPRSSAGPFAPSLTLSLAPDAASVTYATVTPWTGLWLMEGFSEIPLP